LYSHFEKIKLDPKLYLVRWFMVSLTQEFKTQQALKIWDAQLLVKEKISFVHYLCISVLYEMREQLLEGDYSQILLTL
jgi:hypothetical protein